MYKHPIHVAERLRALADRIDKQAATKKITDDQISALRDEAKAAGDREQVKICDRALAGNKAARRECERVIREAEE